MRDKHNLDMIMQEGQIACFAFIWAGSGTILASIDPPAAPKWPPITPKNRPYFLASGWNPAIYRAISHGNMALKGRPVAAGP
jgi:hypothetical protein